MKLKNPLVTLALAGGAFGLSMGAGLAVASAATHNTPTTTAPSSSSPSGPSSSSPSAVEPVVRSTLRRYFFAPLPEHGQLLGSFGFE